MYDLLTMHQFLSKKMELKIKIFTALELFNFWSSTILDHFKTSVSKKGKI